MTVSSNVATVSNISNMPEISTSIFYVDQLLVPIFAAYNNLSLFHNSNGIYILQLYQSDNNDKGQSELDRPLKLA